MRKPALGFVIAAVVIFGLVVAMVTKSVMDRNFRLVSHDPTDTATTVQELYFTFNRDLSDETASNFSISPEVLGRVNIIGKSLVFTPSDNYLINRDYTATISKAIAQDGSTTDDISFSFTVGVVPADKMTDKQREADIAQTDSIEQKDTFLAKLPHETLGYKIDWDSLPPASGQTQKNLLIKIELYGQYNRREQLESYKAQLNQHKQEALDWIRSTGKDPATLKIFYTPDPDDPLKQPTAQ